MRPSHTFVQNHARVVSEDTRKYTGIASLHVFKLEASALHGFIDIFHYVHLMSAEMMLLLLVTLHEKYLWIVRATY